MQSKSKRGLNQTDTAISRFQVHDVLTAPEQSITVLQSALRSGEGQLPNLIGVLAGSPSALRAYARFRSELRHGGLQPPTLERISLAVAQHYDSEAGVALHTQAARALGIGLDEIALAKRFESGDERERVLLDYLKTLIEQGKPPEHLHEEVLEAGWNEAQMLEAIAYIALEIFEALVALAGDVPVDNSKGRRSLSAV